MLDRSGELRGGQGWCFRGNLTGGSSRTPGAIAGGLRTSTASGLALAGVVHNVGKGFVVTGAMGAVGMAAVGC